MAQEATAAAAADAEATAPAWVDEDLIHRALHAEGDIEVPGLQMLSLRLATRPGDNYSSIIYRAHVALGTTERWLLIKVPPQGDAVAQAVVQGGLFRYESAMLYKHIPAMQALLEEACPGGFPPFAARCLLHAALPEPFLVLEDLAPQGFRLAERRRGLGLRHCLLALRSLARFHAASAALLNADPTVANDFTNPLRQNAHLFDNMVQSFFLEPAKVCRQWPGFEDYSFELNKFAPQAMQAIADLHDPKPGRFNVLLHGDCWTNNMMFKYEDGKPVDFRMVDFQVSHVASPAIDLLYFLSTSPSEDVASAHEQLLLREYHVALAETLRLLRLPGPSFEELMADVNAHGLYVLFGALGVWPIVRAETTFDVNASLDGSGGGNAVYESAAVKRHLRRVLPKYRRRGWLTFWKQPQTHSLC